MLNRRSDPTLTDCTFQGNSADYRGGGMLNRESSPVLLGCSFCGNTSRSGHRNVGGHIDAASSDNVLLLDCNLADLNFDFTIDSHDLGYLLAQWGATSVRNADINRDRKVNWADLTYLLQSFGSPTDETAAP